MAKVSPFLGAFDMISEELGEGDMEVTDARHARYVYRGAECLVELHRNAQNERWATVTPPNHELGIRRRRHLYDRVRWDSPRRDNWRDVAVGVSDRIKRVAQLLHERAEEQKKTAATMAAQKRANEFAKPLHDLVKHDKRMRVFADWNYNPGPGRAVVVVSVSLPEDQWHLANLVVDFLKEGCGDPPPPVATVATDSNEEEDG